MILVVVGATASGKSALAMEVARRWGAEILSADSMQVYRGMDIGTAKPTLAEQAQVVHHGIDVATPDEVFTVARFVELADAVIADAARRKVPLIVTGGTPLYYKALFEGLFEGPGEDLAIRAKLASLTNDELAAKLAEVDPAATNRIHRNDTRRMIRALEVNQLTGKPISEFQTHWTNPQPRHRATWVGLNWDKDALNRRINARVKQMMSQGWLEETQIILRSPAGLSKTAGEATGYFELAQHLAGRITLEEAVEQIKIATRQLARRQMKWFRRFPGVEWLAGDRPVEENAEIVMSRLSATSAFDAPVRHP